MRIQKNIRIAFLKFERDFGVCLKSIAPLKFRTSIYLLEPDYELGLSSIIF